MVRFYRCNRTGFCRGCACVKAGRRCSNCLPSWGSCSNVSSTPTPGPTSNSILAPMNQTTTSTKFSSATTSSCSSEPIVSVSDMSSVPDTPTQNQYSISCLPASSQATQSPSISITTPLPQNMDNHNIPDVPNVALPSFQPMSGPVFT